MTQTEESVNVFYLQQLCSDLQQRVFKTPWGSVLIQNCDDDGKLTDYKSVQDFKDSGKSLWLNLKLVLPLERIEESFLHGAVPNVLKCRVSKYGSTA